MSSRLPFGNVISIELHLARGLPITAFVVIKPLLILSVLFKSINRCFAL
jgi:hypothetical protein